MCCRKTGVVHSTFSSAGGWGTEELSASTPHSFSTSPFCDPGRRESLRFLICENGNGDRPSSAQEGAGLCWSSYRPWCMQLPGTSHACGLVEHGPPQNVGEREVITYVASHLIPTPLRCCLSLSCVVVAFEGNTSYTSPISSIRVGVMA